MSVQKALEQDLADLKAGTSRQALKRYEESAGKSSIFSRPQTYLEFPSSSDQVSPRNQVSPQAPSALPQDKAARLAELRRKKAEGTIQ